MKRLLPEKRTFNQTFVNDLAYEFMMPSQSRYPKYTSPSRLPQMRPASAEREQYELTDAEDKTAAQPTIYKKHVNGKFGFFENPATDHHVTFGSNSHELLHPYNSRHNLHTGNTKLPGVNFFQEQLLQVKKVSAEIEHRSLFP